MNKHLRYCGVCRSNWRKVEDGWAKESGPTMTDLYDIVVRLERKIDLLGRRMGAYTTLEGVTREERDSLKGGDQ